MSQESIEIVRAHYASFSRLGERDEIHSHVRGYFDANCEYRPVEEIDAIRGHDALIGWIERWLEAWSSFHIDVEGDHGRWGAHRCCDQHQRSRSHE